MTEALELIEEEFDNLENHYPYSKKSHGIFIGGDDFSAHGFVGEYIKKLEPQELYLGYNGVVYPRFVVEHVRINPEGKVVE